MLLVVMAHALLLSDHSKLGEWFSSYIYLVTQSASLAFMFVSGMIMTYLMRMAGDSSKARLKFFKRGLFLIVIIHPILRLATFVYSNTHHDFLYNMIHDHPITDTIGICLIMAPFLVIATNHRLRLGLIIFMLSLTLAIRLWWHPDSGVAEIIKVGFFGADPGSDTTLAVGWPVIPWLAVFLCGSFIGEMYTAIKKQQISHLEAVKRLRRSAVILMSIGLVLSICSLALKRLNPFDWEFDVFLALYPGRTTFLLPCYLSLMLAVVAYLVLHVDAGRGYNRLFWALSIFGRTSLFTFVSQFIVVWTIPTLLGLKGTLGYQGLVITICSALIVCWFMSYAYGRLRNRVTANDYQELSRVSCAT